MPLEPACIQNTMEWKIINPLQWMIRRKRQFHPVRPDSLEGSDISQIASKIHDSPWAEQRVGLCERGADGYGFGIGAQGQFEGCWLFAAPEHTRSAESLCVLQEMELPACSCGWNTIFLAFQHSWHQFPPSARLTLEREGLGTWSCSPTGHTDKCRCCERKKKRRQLNPHLPLAEGQCQNFIFFLINPQMK